MNEAQKAEWVQRYLEGELSGQELEDFERDLQEDTELQTLLEEYKVLAGGIRYHARMHAWDKIKALEEEAVQEDIAKQISIGKSARFLYWAVAAAVAVVVVSVVYFINTNRQMDTDQLFTENFEPYPALAYAPQRSDTALTSAMEQAFAAYSNGNYQAAITLFEDILAQNEETIVWFYLGNAYLASEQPEQAIAAFQKFLEAEPESVLILQTKWFLALAYLKNEQVEEAKILLNELAEGESSYRKKANEILQSI